MAPDVARHCTDTQISHSLAETKKESTQGTGYNLSGHRLNHNTPGETSQPNAAYTEFRHKQIVKIMEKLRSANERLRESGEYWYGVSKEHLDDK